VRRGHYDVAGGEALEGPESRLNYRQALQLSSRMPIVSPTGPSEELATSGCGRQRRRERAEKRKRRKEEKMKRKKGGGNEGRKDAKEE
jgi:hypothetical protein